jgi:glycosyltransferase involved in cell wall biosynthesis
MRVLVLVNGEPEKAYGVRARELFADFARDHEVTFLYRGDAHKLKGLWRFCRTVLRNRFDVVYIEGFGYAGVIAALLAKAVGRARIVLSTGDLVAAFARTHFSPPKAALAGALEHIAQHAADRLIVYAPFHRQLLEGEGYKRIEWIPNGVDMSAFRPVDVTALRRRLGVDGRLTIGVVGSINWNPQLNFCYGRDVLDVVRHLKDLPVSGIVVGTGNGLPMLRELAREYGIEDRILLTGWVLQEELPSYINAIDVCLSTQSDDVVGAVRITAKVPEYLACGRYIVASDVGGNREFIGDSGKLLPITVLADGDYAVRVADHVRELFARPELLQHGMRGVDVARRLFDYSILRPRLSAALTSL